MRSAGRFGGAALLASACLAGACSSGSGSGSATTTTTGEPASTTTTTTLTEVEVAAAALPEVGAPPAAYELTYRIERPRGDVVAIDTEVRTVEPPFRTRVETGRGEPDDGAEPAVVDLEVLGGLELGPLGQERALVVIQPGPAARGGRFDTDLRAATDAGLVEPTGRGFEIVGRTCTEVRTGTFVDAGVLEAPTAEDHADVCVDDDGIVLREEVTVAGEVLVRRTAVELEILDDVPADRFAPLGWRIPESNGGGRVRAVTDDSRPAGVDHHHLPSAPAGYEHAGRFGVATDTSTGPNAAGAIDRLVSIVDLYVAGPDVLVVENGALVSGGAALAPGIVEVEFARFDDVTAVFHATGVEVRVRFDDGRFLRLRSSGALDDLVSLLESVETVTGPGEVVPADDSEDITGRLRSPEPDHDHGSAGAGHDAADHDHGDLKQDDHRHE